MSQSSEFCAITLCVASQRVFIIVGVYFVMTQSGNFWIHPRIVNRCQACNNHNFKYKGKIIIFLYFDKGVALQLESWAKGLATPHR
jgi:hypothetical protein